MNNKLLPLKKPKTFLWIGIGICLGLMFLFGIVLQDDQQKFKDLQNRFCSEEKLSSNEISELLDLVLKLEKVKIDNTTELTEYLCGKCRNCVFPKDEKMIKKVFGVEMRIFHEQIKQKIKQAAVKNERLRKFLKRYDNPDIGYNSQTQRIVLKSRTNSETIETNLLLQDFQKND